MNQGKTDSAFEEQWARLCFATMTNSQEKMAGFFGVRQSVVSDAMRRGKIPSDWLIILLRVKNISPEWILTGRGTCPESTPGDYYKNAGDAAERREQEDALRSLPSRMLADELVRRTAVADIYAIAKKEKKAE